MNASERQTIRVPAESARALQAILDVPEGQYPEARRDGVIETFSAYFQDGRFAVDVKVCNGDTPFVDTVLFERVAQKPGEPAQYQEIDVLEPGDRLLGEHAFDVDGLRLTAEIVAE